MGSQKILYEHSLFDYDTNHIETNFRFVYFINGSYLYQMNYAGNNTVRSLPIGGSDDKCLLGSQYDGGCLMCQTDTGV